MLAPTAYHLLACKTIVTFNTRLHPKLDHVFVNCKYIFKAHKRAPPSTSDHNTTYAPPCIHSHTNRCKLIRSSFRTLNSRNVSSSNMSNLSTLLEQTDLSLFYSPSVDESIDTVTFYVRFCYDICCPVEKMYIYPHKISSPLLNCLRRMTPLFFSPPPLLNPSAFKPASNSDILPLLSRIKWNSIESSLDIPP